MERKRAVKFYHFEQTDLNFISIEFLFLPIPDAVRKVITWVVKNADVDLFVAGRAKR